MADTDTKQQDSQNLLALLTAMQNGVIAINNLTKTVKLVFPSTS